MKKILQVFIIGALFFPLVSSAMLFLPTCPLMDYTADSSLLNTLNTTLSTAQNKYDLAVQGNLIGQYPSPLKANLKSIIDSVKNSTASKTKCVVSNTITSLNEAITTFEKGVVLATPPVSPTVTITASPSTITYGSSSILTWDSTNAYSCISSGGWNNNSTSVPVHPTSTSTYTLTCNGAGGTTSKSVTVTVLPLNSVQEPIQLTCSEDVWTCGNYGICSIFGIQSRICTKTFDCPNVQTPAPATDTSCQPTQTTTSTSFDVNLKYGARGLAVEKLQDFLFDQNFYKGKIDGAFGLGTLRAVQAFQKANNLSSDGYFGKISRNKATIILSEILKASQNAEQTENGTNFLKDGCTTTSAFSITTGQPCNNF